MSGSETSTGSPAATPAPIPFWPPDEAAGSVREKLGAQSRAARAQDKFNSNRSVGAGGNVLPGLRGLLARAWPPGSDSSSGRHGGCPHSTLVAVAGSMICFSQVEKPLPKRSSECPHSAEILQAAGEGAQRWPGSRPPHLSAAGIPDTGCRRRCGRKLFSGAWRKVVEKEAQRDPATVPGSHGEALRSGFSRPAPAPLRSSLTIANHWGKTDFGIEGRGWPRN